LWWRWTTSALLALNVWPCAEILFEVADWASHEFVLVEGERNNGDEAKGKEWPLGDAACRPVTTVVTLRRHVLVSFELAVKIVRADDKAKSHIDR